MREQPGEGCFATGIHPSPRPVSLAPNGALLLVEGRLTHSELNEELRSGTLLESDLEFPEEVGPPPEKSIHFGKRRIQPKHRTPEFSRTEYDLTEDRDNRGPRWKLSASNAASANLILHKFRVANPEYGCEQLRQNRAVSPAVHEPEQNHAPPATEPYGQERSSARRVRSA